MSYILTFASTHGSILAEKTLLQAGYSVGVMPLPSGIKAGCGIALRVADHIGAKALLQENNVVVAAVYQASVNAHETVYNQVKE